MEFKTHQVGADGQGREGEFIPAGLMAPLSIAGMSNVLFQFFCRIFYEIVQCMPLYVIFKFVLELEKNSAEYAMTE